MILQNVQLNKQDIQGTRDLYYRIDGEYNNYRAMVLMSGTKLSTNTYFNSFSWGKWSKYTVINNVCLHLQVEGHFILRMYYSKIEQDSIKSLLLQEYEYKLDKDTDIEIKLPIDNKLGNYHFTIEAKEQTTLYEASYQTVAQEKSLKMAIVICTYRREEMVKKCVTSLINDVFKNKKSRVRDSLQVYIVDNGQSLETDLGHPSVNVIQNKNYGGAGGFTRGIIASIEDKDEFTHVLLMDDDALVKSEAIEMTYALISLMKPDYKEYVIGGGLLRQDIPYLQYEVGALWNQGRIDACNHNLDLRDYMNVLYNELEGSSIDYNGWWYCCIPLSRIKKVNLPLPIFIHRDDIEYGLRMKHQFIHLNGISVWHEAFENKMQGVLDYYELRNLAITNAIHADSYSSSMFKSFFIKRCLSNIFKNQYLYVEFNIKAVEDFCKGVDYFKKIDPEKLHSELLACNYKSIPLEELRVTYSNLEGYLHKLDLEKYEPSGIRRKRNNILTTFVFNGMLLPLRNKPIILQSNMPMYYNFAARTTIHTDGGNKAFVTSHSYRAIWKSIVGIVKTSKLIDREYDIACKEYNERYIELTNLVYWKDYLGISQ
jgi:GT2 family glycosyltransferase